MSDFKPTQFPTVPPTRKGIEIALGANVPMTYDEIEAAIHAGACPCDRGIFGVCDNASRTRWCAGANIQQLVHLWRVAWAFLVVGEFAVPACAVTPEGKIVATA